MPYKFNLKSDYIMFEIKSFLKNEKKPIFIA